MKKRTRIGAGIYLLLSIILIFQTTAVAGSAGNEITTETSKVTETTEVSAEETRVTETTETSSETTKTPQTETTTAKTETKRIELETAVSEKKENELTMENFPGVTFRKANNYVDVNDFDKSLQLLYDNIAEVQQTSLQDACNETEKYIENETFNFYYFLCTISKNDPFEVYASLNKETKDKLLERCNSRERYALEQFIAYASLDYLQQHRTEKGLEIYCNSLEQILCDFQFVHKETEGISDLDILMDHFFQMRSANYYKHIYPGYLTENKAFHDIKDVSEILQDVTQKKLSVKGGIKQIRDVYSNLDRIAEEANKYFIPVYRAKEAYKTGAVYFAIKDGKSTKMTIKLSRSSAPSWSSFTTTSYTYNCSWTGTNNHSAKLNQSTVKTKKDQDGGYTIINFSISYTQSAHWKKDRADIYKADCADAGRLNFKNYNAAGDGDNSFVDALVHSNTSRSVNMQVNVMETGVRDCAQSHRHGSNTTYGGTLVFERPNRTVTFNNGYGSTITTKTVADGATVAAPANPNRTGYNFTGWSGTVGAIVCANRTHTAQWTPWKHTVAYNANGGSGVPGNQTKTYGVQMNLNTSQPSRTYYNFAGWNTAANGSGTKWTPGQNYNKDQNGGTVTLYAQWTPWQHTVSYHANGGTNAPANGTKVYGQAYNISTQIPQKAGAIFAGWNTAADGSGTAYVAGSSYNHDQNGGSVNLYARWEPLYGIHYEKNKEEASGTIESQIEKQNQPIYLKKNGYEYKNGVFTSWQLKDSNVVYSEEKKVTYEELKRNIEPQLQEKQYLLPSAFNNRTAAVYGVFSETIEPLENDIFTMKAQWNEKPKIILSAEEVCYIEGENVLTDSLLNYVEQCSDQEDGDLKDHVVIQKITYGKSNDGYQPAVQETIYEDTKLDTYFKHLKEDEKVEAVVTYAVTDSYGNMVTADKKVTILYNEPPKIKAYHLSYFESEMKEEPDRVRKEIKENPTAKDKEDDERKIPLSVHMKEPCDISKMEKAGLYQVTYQVKDSMGKETEVTIDIYVAKDDPYATADENFIRFISKKYLHTLKEDSRWNQESYRNYLKESLDRSEEDAAEVLHFQIKN